MTKNSRKKNSRAAIPIPKVEASSRFEVMIASLISRYGFFLLIVFGLLSTWQLWEQDIFWQIRAGDEILSGMGLQTVDTWSFTGAGRPWINFQWLATVLIRMAYGFGREGGLVVFRAICAMILFSIMAAILRQNPQDKKLSTAFILLPWIFLCIAFKIEMRSDLFNFILFAGLIWLWASQGFDRYKTWLTLVCSLIAVNLHAGTAPFVILLSCVLLISDARITFQKRLVWCVASALTMFANPYGYKVLAPIKDIFFYSETNLFDNYDHYALMFGRASLEQFGIAAWAWSIYAVCAAIAFLSETKSNWKKSRLTWVVTFLMGVILTTLSINRMRAIPYHVLFFLPYMGRALDRPFSLTLSPVIRRLMLAVFAVLLIYGFSVQEKNYPLQRGLSLSPVVWPMGSARFIASTKPQGQILHTWGYGGYFVWHLRDYKTFGDPREAMFWDLQSKMLAAQGDPAVMRRLCQEYGINIAVIPTPAPQFNQEARTFIDGLSVIFPAQEWALVYFDDISTVLIKRIPAHQAIIQKNEFLYLKPQLPGTFSLRSSRQDAVSDVVFKNELTRCRTNEPLNVICRIAQSNLWRKTEDATHLAEARSLLEEVDERPTTQKFEFLNELKTVYQKLGMSHKTTEIDQRINELLRASP